MGNNNKNYSCILMIMLLSVIIILVGTLITQNKNVIIQKENNKIDITIWNLQGSTTTALYEIIPTYKEKYPEINFIVKNYENEIYKRKIMDTLITNEGPDIFFSWGYSFLRPFIEEDRVLDITEDINEVEYFSKLPKNMTEGFTRENRVFGLPIQGFNVVLYINKDLFEANNLEYPQTYNDLIKTIEFFNHKDIVPISIGGKEDWMLSLLYSVLLAQESDSGSDKSYENAAVKLRALVDEGAFGDGFKEKTVRQSINSFMKGETAMLFAGSFYSSSIEELINDNVNNIDVITFPPVDKDNSSNRSVAGYIDTFVINKNTENKDIVIKVYMDLMKDLSDNLVLKENNGLPVWQNFDDVKDSNKLIYKAYKQLCKGDNVVPLDVKLTGADVNEHYRLLNDLITGNISVDEFIKEMASIKK